MSRCFPFPPSGYVRNPVAVAEAESTAKLQKEREKAEKKQKRSEKKALQKGETSKHSKHSHKKRKHEAISAAVQEPKKVSKDSVEQLEKSGLSEEHGVPCFIQMVQLSPESSQDSSKRRKVVLPSPRLQKNGNIVRIKIKNNQDSAAVLEKPKVPEQLSVPQMGSVSSLLSKKNSIHQKHGGSRTVQKQVRMELPAQIVQSVHPKTTGKAMQTPAKSPVRKVDHLHVTSLESLSLNPQGASVTQRFEPPPAKTTQRLQPSHKLLQSSDPLLPSEFQGRFPPASAEVMQNETKLALRQPEAPEPNLTEKQRVDSSVKRDQETVTCEPAEEPCFSGRDADAVSAQEAKQSKSDKLSKSERKKSRKAEKKEKKFSDLFVTWNPLSFEMGDSDLGEQDWLLGSTRNSDASMTSCRASDGSVQFQLEQQPLLQPRATLLQDLHIYQLPYVVPF